MKRCASTYSFASDDSRQPALFPRAKRRLSAPGGLETNYSFADTDKRTGPRSFIISSLASQGFEVVVRPSLSMAPEFFHTQKEEHNSSYRQEAIKAIRSRDLASLREIKNSGHTLQCSNKFGDSLIHMACRRGFPEVVCFLMKEAGVSIRVVDENGRTPLHDACWTSQPNFTLMETLLEEAPEMLLLSDKRGHTPLEYARREHRTQWESFFFRKEHLLVPKDKKALTPFISGVDSK